MKNIYTLTIALVALLSQTTIAQVKIGGSLGIGGSKAKTDYFNNSVGLKSLLTIPVQVNAEFGIGKQLVLATGLFFNSKGVVGKETYSSGNYDQRSFKMSCLDIPIYVKIKVYDKQNISILPMFGMYVSTNIGGKVTTSSKTNTSTNNSSKDLDLDYYKFKGNDFGYLLGVNLEYKIKSGSIYARPMYQGGFNDIHEGTNYLWKNRLTQLNIGYLYTIK
jgi:Outer membrane protein beta-barrel domain